MNEESDGTLVRRTQRSRGLRSWSGGTKDGLQRGAAHAHDARGLGRHPDRLLKVYEHLGEYDPSHKFYSWIYRIALNESIKSLQRRKPTAALDVETPDGTPGPEGAFDQRQLSEGMAAAIMTLRRSTAP
jgi:hypothetical protein